MHSSPIEENRAVRERMEADSEGWGAAGLQPRHERARLGQRQVRSRVQQTLYTVAGLGVKRVIRAFDAL